MELDATKATESAAADESANAETIEATDWDDLGGDEVVTVDKEQPIGRRPTLIRIVADILMDEKNSPTGNAVELKAGTEIDRFDVDKDGDIWIASDPENSASFDLMLESDEYEIVSMEGDPVPDQSDATPDDAAAESDQAEAAAPSAPLTGVRSTSVQQQLDASEEWQQAVREARATVRVCETLFEEAREEARRAKKDWEAAMKSLCDVIDGEPGRYPLFDGSKPAAAEAATDETGEAGGDQAGEPQGVEAAAEDDSWKFVPMSELIKHGLSAGIVEILAANPELPINTIGHLTDWTAAKKDYDSPLTLIPKIGKGKSEKIEEALLKFWAARKPKS